jgi:choline dehydrogenase-like flavoprotein
MKTQLFTTALLAVLSLGRSARILSSPEELATTEYDFVVVGGGTAGLVVAARLSEYPNVTVLIVEAGGDDRNYPDARVPFLAAELQNTGADWNYTTTPQPGYNNRSINFERGHVLGGSSTVNYMAYNRASDDVYDRWANITGDAGWSWSSLEPYYYRNSRLVAPADGRKYSCEVIASAHGHGPVEVSVPGDPHPVDHRFIGASKELGARFSFNQDLNAGNFVGLSWSQGAIGRGERSSAATAYLHPLLNACQNTTAGSRTNLDVLLNTQVTKLLRNGNGSDCLRLTTAELGQSANSSRINVTARKEIILSAGVIGTPKILMQSGIGPAPILKALNMSTVVDLPSVGRNLTDHPLNALYFTVDANTTVDPLFQQAAAMEQALQEWNDTRRGPYTDTAANTIAMLRLPQNASILSSTPDPAAGPLSSNEELLFAEGFVPLSNIPLPSSGNFITILSIVTSPTSRGSVTLNSTDPFSPPVIDPNYLATDFDQHTAVQAMRDAFTILSARSFDGYVGAPYGPLAGLSTDEELLGYVRQHGVTINHGVGTAKMSPKDATWGVVDPDLKVKGVEGVRVVDASVFPEIPECHTMAPVYILAEKAADIIRKTYGFAV